MSYSDVIFPPWEVTYCVSPLSADCLPWLSHAPWTRSLSGEPSAPVARLPSYPGLAGACVSQLGLPPLPPGYEFSPAHSLALALASSLILSVGGGCLPPKVQEPGRMWLSGLLTDPFPLKVMVLS